MDENTQYIKTLCTPKLSKVQHLLSCYIACIYNHFTPLWGFIRRVSLSSFPFFKALSIMLVFFVTHSVVLRPCILYMMLALILFLRDKCIPRHPSLRPHCVYKVSPLNLSLCPKYYWQ